MIHASVELVEAMRGECPRAAYVLAGGNPATPRILDAACGAGGKDTIYAGGGWARHAQAFEPKGAVDCPACLALMAAARGAERTAELMVYADALEGVVAAAQQARSECVRCPRCRGDVMRVPGGVDCAGGCYFGLMPTPEQFVALERRDNLAIDAEAAVARLSVIRAAVPVVPGVAA